MSPSSAQGTDVTKHRCGGDVTIHMASAGTADCTELAIRTAVTRAGMPHRLVVGDGGSRDGSVEMLTSFRDRGWLELQALQEPREHSRWLDHWLATCPTRWAVFVDSDIEFRRDGWLREMVEAAEHGNHALVCGEMLSAGPHTIEPVSHAEVYLAPRPAPWLLLVDCAKIRALGMSFGFVSETSNDRPEGIIAYDTGAKLFACLEDVGLSWTAMPRSFTRGYTHFGNMSWAHRFGDTRAHRAKTRRVDRHLRRVRRADLTDL